MTRKLLALLLALLLMIALLSACKKADGSDGKDEKNEDKSQGTSQEEDKTANDETVEEVPETEPEHREITGEIVEYGGYTMLVPEGFTLKEPGEFSYYDISVEKSDLSFFYFITEDDDERMMQNYNYNKSIYSNRQHDVEAVYGENTWTGFQYSDGFGGFGFEAYATVNGKIVRVSSAGFSFDSDEAMAVLASFGAK